MKVLNSIRTNNFSDEHVMEKISAMCTGASTELSNYKGITYGLYHEYESDYKGDYTLCVAIEELFRMIQNLRFLKLKNKAFFIHGMKFGIKKRKAI